MDESVYKIIELKGQSKANIEAAIQNALTRAAETVRNIKWFEITKLAGEIEEDRVSQWQVGIKAGFEVEGKTDSKKKTETGKKESNKYRCKVCGYIYDPQKGDPSQGVKPGTAFEDLPDSWKCPECGVGKDQFEKV